MSTVFYCQAFSACSSGAFSWLLPGHVAQCLRRLPKQVKHMHAHSLEGCGADPGLPIICPAERFKCFELVFVLSGSGRVVNMHMQAENNDFSIFRKFKSMF